MKYYKKLMINIRGVRTNKTLFLLFLFNLLTMLFLFVFSGENFTVDGYGILLSGPERHINAFIGSYRFFGAFVYYLLSLTGHNPFYGSIYDVTFFILLTAFIVTLLVNEYIKQLECPSTLNILILDIAVLISVLNVWFCNILSFLECVFITAIGLFLCLTSVILMHYKRVWTSLLSAVFLLCATAVYQQFMVMFLVHMIAYVCIQLLGDKLKKFSDWLSLIGRYVSVILASGLSYIFLALYFVKKFKLKGSNRVSLSFESIIDKINFYADKQKLYLSGREYYESKIMLHCFMFLFVVAFLSLLIYVVKKKKYCNAIVAFVSLFISYCLVYLPGVVSEGDGIRQLFVLYTMFLVVSCIVLMCVKNRKLLSVFCAFLIIVLSVNTVKIIESESNLKKMNVMDENWAMMVIANIEDYEETHKTEIQNVSFCNDMNPTGNSVGISYTESAVRIPYSRENLILLNAKDKEKHFDIVQTPDEIYKMYFEGKDWDSFCGTEQIVYIDDVAYICCY